MHESYNCEVALEQTDHEGCVTILRSKDDLTDLLKRNEDVVVVTLKKKGTLVASDDALIKISPMQNTKLASDTTSNMQSFSKTSACKSEQAKPKNPSSLRDSSANKSDVRKHEKKLIYNNEIIKNVHSLNIFTAIRRCHHLIKYSTSNDQTMSSSHATEVTSHHNQIYHDYFEDGLPGYIEESDDINSIVTMEYIKDREVLQQLPKLDWYPENKCKIQSDIHDSFAIDVKEDVGGFFQTQACLVKILHSCISHETYKKSDISKLLMSIFAEQLGAVGVKYISITEDGYIRIHLTPKDTIDYIKNSDTWMDGVNMFEAHNAW